MDKIKALPRVTRMAIVIGAVAILGFFSLDSDYVCDDEGCKLTVAIKCIGVTIGLLDEGYSVGVGQIEGCEEPLPE